LLEQDDAAGWLLGHGWSFDALRGRPGARLLDEAAPGRPVALWAHDHHSRWLSSAAVAAAAIGRREDPPAGRIERDAEGRPTGILFEHAAGLVDEVIPAPTAASIEVAITAYARELAQLGVTSVHDPGGVAPDPELHAGPTLYRSLATAGRLPLRVMACVREEQLDRAIAIGFRTGRTEGGPASGRYRDGWLKLFSDGALGSRTAALLAPYEADDAAGPPPGGPTGMPLRDGPQLAALAGRAAEAGIASQIHAIGDGAVRTVLDVLARLPAVSGARHRVEHAQLVDPADVPRFASLDVAASVQPCHLLSDASAIRHAWGGRARSAFPLADLDRAGTLLPFGTDAPVEPADPWRGIAAAVTRRGVGWPPERALHPEQAVSLARALRAACLDGPRSAHLDDQGHLGVGARADFVVLPGTAFEVTDEAGSTGPSSELLSELRPLATVLDGQTIWRSPDLDP
jgi:predicted amidohydrolase YtcJ